MMASVSVEYAVEFLYANKIAFRSIPICRMPRFEEIANAFTIELIKLSGERTRLFFPGRPETRKLCHY